MSSATEKQLAATIGGFDWPEIERSLDTLGNAVLPGLLTEGQCDAIAGLYATESCFRTTIVMARHGFGRGEYKYFAYPLPPLLDALRHALYARLAFVANRWNDAMGVDVRFPSKLGTYLRQCHEAGQTRPTPLLLEYRRGDYNCLHQDLYGEHVFPLQVAILLSKPGAEFEGGEFVMTEHSARAQRAEVVALDKGDAVIFTVNQRPSTGARGRTRRVLMRHGVSAVRRGMRYTAGLIFHDSR
ncbi:2OG-Fe(II) oxygenase [Burkholderia pseudomultivorans]|uniref:Proline hydroxylase n=1 Tax=Burkholderia pseudomultivorans TaxID=1207504 RepID=A0A132EJA9_9BURK|nr:2OG-Fe(II) oxygenase [Burkholderia pseudomultivorans]KWF30874.1 proline hydroxylase [Burkholderia pseudomultivorans]